ncbi:hypothetical protein Pmani_038091 [Petrolisthes manimaculis]|uniref:Uncharacterized protein n=1 Tax=Petrolisthes manimaculis TaxID=1843537 RepID=A0AAE1NH28_9EUCA|nr:hypothetical protein Pmani_038091 [Petrolisthes manimaculis]
MTLQHTNKVGPVTILLVLLLLPLPSYTFLWRSEDDHSGELELVRPLAELALGGGTRIVWEMITFGFLSPIKPAIREAIKSLVVNTTTFTLSTIISSIWSIISIVAQFIYWFIEFNVFLSWRIKWDIISFILDQLNPFSKRELVDNYLGRSLSTLVSNANEVLFEAQ